jgi:hypothetical protein
MTRKLVGFQSRYGEFGECRSLLPPSGIEYIIAVNSEIQEAMLKN